MARLFDDASSQYLEYAGAVVTGPPFSVIAWFQSDDLTNGGELWSLANITNGTADYFRLNFTAGPISIGARDFATAANVFVPTTTSVTAANTWHCAAGVWATTASRSVYLDGGGKATDTTLVAPSGMARTAIGRLVRFAPTAYFSGLIACVAMWNIALTDAEVLSLAQGLDPLRLQRANLIDYWLHGALVGQASPEPSLLPGSSHAMTVTGATVSTSQPPVYGLPSVFTPEVLRAA